MSTVPHAANGGEEISLHFFGCQSDSPPMRHQSASGARLTNGDTSTASSEPGAARDPSEGERFRAPIQGPFHRVAQIRAQQGISERTMAKRLGIEVRRYRELENPNRDLTLSQLSALQRALEVPFADLLEDRHALSRPTEERAKLLKVMKTAVALREAKISPRADRMAQMLCEQLIDLMPELADVSGWPQFGARRGTTAVGRALQQPIDTSNMGFQD